MSLCSLVSHVCCLQVADVGGEVKGMIGIQPTSVGDSSYYATVLLTEGKVRADNMAELRRMAVHSEYRKQGIGAKLMNELVRLCLCLCIWK